MESLSERFIAAIRVASDDAHGSGMSGSRDEEIYPVEKNRYDVYASSPLESNVQLLRRKYLLNGGESVC
jgi:hypothetical protein